MLLAALVVTALIARSALIDGELDAEAGEAAGAVAVALDFDAHPVHEREPQVRHDQAVVLEIAAWAERAAARPASRVIQFP